MEEIKMSNMPQEKIGIVAVSRDCFPESLSVNRRKALVEAYTKKYGSDNIYECPICIVESEIHMVQALEDIKKAGCNALVVYLGNFGPEISETLLAKHFDGPSMFIAAAEETSANGGLVQGRGDAYCGMLNASYNLKLRNVRAYIPEYPIGTADECADMIHEFAPIARAIIAVRDLKIISFGPRPQNFLACNAPIKQLYNLGVEIEENSELDLFEAYNKHAGDPRIPDVAKDMAEELGAGNKKPEVLEKLAQYEITLLDWVEAHKGYKKYVTIAGKCWPAFQTQFGFVPCYVNSRLTKMGIPVACEVDIYGALSEFIGTVVSNDAVTLLDINNTVPADIYGEDIKGKFNYTSNEVFMGFHCGNTASTKLTFCEMRNQMIMARSLPVEVTNGTLEGDIVPGDITFFRLQSTSDAQIRAYIAQGEVLPVATRSFGAIGIFAIPEMDRFYRHVLIEKNYPHHGAVAFGHFGKALYEVFKYLGAPADEINFNQPKGMMYPTENPFK
jgi:L-fucose isomerase-like protein